MVEEGVQDKGKKQVFLFQKRDRGMSIVDLFFFLFFLRLTYFTAFIPRKDLLGLVKV